MGKDFTNTAEKIEARRLAITEALEAEAEAISEAEPMLLEHYKKSVQNVLNGLISSTEEQGQELFKELRESNDSLRKSFIRTRKVLLKVLLPTALLIGVTIGILGTAYYTHDHINLAKHQDQIVTDGKTRWLVLNKIAPEPKSDQNMTKE